MDRKYEVGLPFIGCTVDVVFDPADISELTIEYEGHSPWHVRELVIGERAGKRPPLPEHLALFQQMLQDCSRQRRNETGIVRWSKPLLLPIAG